MDIQTAIIVQKLDRHIDEQVKLIEHTLADNVVDSGTRRMREWLRQGTMTEREYWAMLGRVARIIEMDLLKAVPRDRRQEVKRRIEDAYWRAGDQQRRKRQAH